MRVTTMPYAFLSKYRADIPWPKEFKMTEKWQNIKKKKTTFYAPKKD